MAVCIAASNRPRITISSRDFPQLHRNLNTGGDLYQELPGAEMVAMQTVLHNAKYASHLTADADGEPVSVRWTAVGSANRTD